MMAKSMKSFSVTLPLQESRHIIFLYWGLLSCVAERL